MTIPLGGIIAAEPTVHLGLSLPAELSWLAPAAFGVVLWVAFLIARSSIHPAAAAPTATGEHDDHPSVSRLAA